MRVVIDGERALAKVLGNGELLNVWIRYAVTKDHGSEVDMLESRYRSNRKLFVGVVDHLRNVRSVCPTITFRCDMERLSRILGESVEEKFKEGVNILASHWTGVDGLAVVGVGISNVDGLIQKNDICISIPTVRIPGCVAAIVSDPARPKLEQQPSG